MTLCTSFSPVLSKRPRTLILGSMPGVRSLQEAQYYAHPQNAFWKIMAELYEMPIENYVQRRNIILGNQLALWDTLKSCIRPGSLDAAIDSGSIEANDFSALFITHPAIERVFFNGGTAAAVFRKHALPQLSPEIRDRLSFTQLPSTSPAYAGVSFRKKLEKWRAVRA